MRASTLRLSLGLLCLGLAVPGQALAARKAPPPPAATAATAEPATKPDTIKPGTAWTAAEPANCTRMRRKLWQEGEGWLVKTVSVCR